MLGREAATTAGLRPAAARGPARGSAAGRSRAQMQHQMHVGGVEPAVAEGQVLGRRASFHPTRPAPPGMLRACASISAGRVDAPRPRAQPLRRHTCEPPGAAADVEQPGRSARAVPATQLRDLIPGPRRPGAGGRTSRPGQKSITTRHGGGRTAALSARTSRGPPFSANGTSIMSRSRGTTVRGEHRRAPRRGSRGRCSRVERWVSASSVTCASTASRAASAAVSARSGGRALGLLLGEGGLVHQQVRRRGGLAVAGAGPRVAREDDRRPGRGGAETSRGTTRRRRASVTPSAVWSLPNSGPSGTPGRRAASTSNRPGRMLLGTARSQGWEVVAGCERRRSR